MSQTPERKRGYMREYMHRRRLRLAKVSSQRGRPPLSISPPLGTNNRKTARHNKRTDAFVSGDYLPPVSPSVSPSRKLSGAVAGLTPRMALNYMVALNQGGHTLYHFLHPRDNKPAYQLRPLPLTDGLQAALTALAAVVERQGAELAVTRARITQLEAGQALREAQAPYITTGEREEP